MTTLMLTFVRTPAYGGLTRFARACGSFIDALAEAQEMARIAQQRYPFAVE